MKKITILWIMSFIIFSQIYADENSDKIKNISFRWQLYNYQENSQKINFIILNPMFYDNYLSVTLPSNIELNNTSQNKRKTQTVSQRNNPGLFALTTIISLVAIMAGSEQDCEIRSNMWAQQREKENMYRKLYNDFTRNYYQGIY